MTSLDPTDLVRIDPARNMARFYSLGLQPTLFGEVSVIRYWGRIGTRGRAMCETYSTVALAEAALQRLATTKGRRGYKAREHIPQNAL